MMQTEILAVDGFEKHVNQIDVTNENEVVESPVIECRQESSQGSKSSGQIQYSSRESPPQQLAKSKVKFDRVSKHCSNLDSITPRYLKNPSRTKSKSHGSNSSGANIPCVFERLSNTQTKASLHRMGVARRINGGERRASSAPPLRVGPKSALCIKKKTNDGDLRKVSSKNSFEQLRPKSAMIPKKKGTCNEQQKILSLERLAGKHTALSSSRQRREDGTTRDRDCKLIGKKIPPQRNRRKMRSASQGRSPMERWKSAPSVLRIRKPRNEFPDDYSVASTANSIGPPLVIEFSYRMKLLSCNTHRPEDDDVEIDPIELGVDSSVAKYEAGALSMKDMASEMMVGMFLRDLADDREWEIGRPLDRELSMPIGEKGFSFFIEATTKNHDTDENTENQDIEIKRQACSVSATANVIFVHESLEILVENYSFVRDGLRDLKVRKNTKIPSLT